MSALNPGRNSPEPETLSGAQQQDPMFTQHIPIDTRPAAELGHQLSEDEDLELPSNPVSLLEKIEEAKYGNSTRVFEEGSLIH